MRPIYNYEAQWFSWNNRWAPKRAGVTEGLVGFVKGSQPNQTCWPKGDSLQTGKVNAHTCHWFTLFEVVQAGAVTGKREIARLLEACPLHWSIVLWNSTVILCLVPLSQPCHRQDKKIAVSTDFAIVSDWGSNASFLVSVTELVRLAKAQYFVVWPILKHWYSITLLVGKKKLVWSAC